MTAQRRSENVQRTALAITAINGGALTRQGITNAQGLASLVPSLTVGTDGAYTQVFLRGIGDFGGTPLSESPVAVNVDQVYQASAALTSGYFYDIDRVELLKGPQGTLYGRNASGGALNILTKRPDFDSVNGYLTAGYGNYNAYQVEAAVNLPISPTLAVRSAGQILGHDGYYKDGYDDDKRRGGRVEALYKPVDDVSVLLIGDYEQQGGQGGGASITPNPVPGKPWIGESDPRSNAVITSSPGIGPFLRTVGNDGFNKIKTWGVSGDLKWDLGPVTLDVIPGYRHYDVNILTYSPGFYDRVSSPQHQFSLETRLGSSTNGPLKYTIGAYYYDQGGHGVYAVDFGPVIQQSVYPVDNTKDVSAAAFAQASYSLTHALRLTGGLRYTYEKKTLDSGVIQSPSFSTTTFQFLPCGGAQTTVAAPQGLGFLPGSPFFCSSNADGRLKVNKVNWKAGIEYDVAPQSLLFFTAGTGFKAGGFSQGNAPNTFGPEKLLAYELGSKNRFLDNKLQVNLEGFLWKYSDQQVSQVGVINPAPLLGYLVRNAGKATLYGVDLDLQYRVTPHDTLGLAGEYLHTKYDSYQYNSLVFLANPATTGCRVTNLDPLDVSVSCAGKPLVRSPKWSGTATYEHVFDLESGATVTFAARTHFSSGYYTATNYVRGPGYQSSFTDSSVDLTYAAPGKRFLLTGFVKNIEDKAVSSGSFEQAYVAGVFYNSLKPPRTYGVRGTFNF